jgi:hypothetical protein
MAVQNPGVVQFPTPPDNYDTAYMAQLVRMLNRAIQDINNPGHIHATDANFSALPTSATGLRTGDIWNDSGTIKIV